MNEINLSFLELKTFTEQDALDYCQINNINPEDITELDLSWNKLTDISGIKIFKNVKDLYLKDNELTDISAVKYLKNIEYLNITYLELESDQIKYIKSLKNLEDLSCYKGFKDMNILNQLNNNIKIIK